MSPALRAPRCLSIVLPALVMLSLPGVAGAQASAADGPWWGQAECVLRTRAANYEDEQIHKWRITGGPPRVTGSTRHWPAVWSVQGRGRRLLAPPTGRGAASLAAAGSGPSDTWTIDSAGVDAPIAIWEIPLTAGNRLRIASQHGQKNVSGGIRVSRSAGGDFGATLWEWEFPSAEDLATATTISGSRTRTLPVAPAGWQTPSPSTTTETCTWHFTKGGAPATLAGPTGAVSGPGRAGGAPVPSGITGGSAGAVAGAVGAVASPVAPTAVRADATADLAVTIVASDPAGASVAPTPGSTVRYLVSVTNRGPAAAGGATLTVPGGGGVRKTLVTCSAQSGGQCPSGLEVSRLEGGLVLPSIPAGGAVTVSLFGRVEVSAGNSVSVTGTISTPAGVPDPNPANNSSSQTLAVVALTRTGTANLETYINPDPRSATSWAPNAVARYDVTVANFGPDAAPGTVLTIPAAENVTMTTVMCAAQNGSQCPPGVTLGQLEAGVVIAAMPRDASVTFTLSGTVTGPLGAAVTLGAMAALPNGLISQYPQFHWNFRSTAIQPPSLGSAGRATPLSPRAGSPGVVETGGAPELSAAPVTCTFPGPAVTVSSVSPGHVRLTWSAIQGATYTVSRNDMGQLPRPRFGLFGVELGPTEFEHRAPLFHDRTYEYMVTAHYGQGCGSSRVSVSPPRPFVPLARVEPSPGESAGSGLHTVAGALRPPPGTDGLMLRLADGFLVLGAGLPPDGREIRPSYAQFEYWASGCHPRDLDCRRAVADRVVRDEVWWTAVVPAGDHAWLVVPFWDTDEGRMIDVRYGARVTLKVP